MTLMLSPSPSSHHWVIPRNYPVNTDIRLEEVCRAILRHMQSAADLVERTKLEFIDRNFTELQLTQEGATRQKWLPPVPTRPYLRQVKLNDFFFKCFHLFQHFSVVLEQMIIDQKRLRGCFFNEYNALDRKLFKIIFELYRGMKILQCYPIINVDKDVLPWEVRKAMGSFKTVRDYLSLRDLSFTLASLSEQFKELCGDLDVEPMPFS